MDVNGRMLTSVTQIRIIRTVGGKVQHVADHILGIFRTLQEQFNDGLNKFYFGTSFLLKHRQISLLLC
jgi:hypothetical protein